MNKLKFLPLALATVLFSACASDDTPDTKNDGSDISYLSVNLMNVGEAPGTRAEYDESGTYEDGSEAESKINSVRFYFFNSDGSPYLLRNTNKNWMSPNHDINGDDNNHGETVEKISQTVLVIDGEERTAPHSVVAIINPDALANNLKNTLGDGAQSLSNMREILDNKFYDGNGTGAKNFVMSNSVYVSAGAEVCATQVSGHVATSAESANANPIEIYVERVAAKVSASIDKSKWVEGTASTWGEGKWAYKLSEKLNSKYDVYAVLEGWGVADENGRATVEKTISATWNSNELGISPWTTADYHRCFWSNSVNFGTDMGGNSMNQPVNHNYNAISSTLDAPVYTLPNTPNTVGDFGDPMENNLTKFIIAAKLVYKNDEGQWKNAEICQFKGIQYLGADEVLKVVANENKKYCRKSTAAEGDTYTSLTPADYEFSTTATSNPDLHLKDYEVIPQIKSTVTDDIYEVTTDGNGHVTSSKLVQREDANKAIATSANIAQIRTEGRAYYYTPIRHLATDNTKLGYYGVVRNHSYKINITSVNGFGTPVFDPTKVIDPTLPSENNSYLSARINVLSWRVVKSDVNLDSNSNNSHK